MSQLTDALPLAQSARVDVYRKITWHIMPFIVVCYLCAYLDRVNVGFAKLQMLADLQFSDAIYGLGAGIFFIGYFIFEVPSNLILHRVGARRWIARIMVTWAIISAATLFVSTPTEFYIVRFLLGVAEAGFSAYVGHNPTLAVIALSVAAAGILSALSLFWGIPSAFLAGTSAAAGIAGINCVGNLAGFVSPYMVGWLNVYTGNTQIGLYAVAAFMIVGALLVRTVSGRLADR